MSKNKKKKKPSPSQQTDNIELNATSSNLSHHEFTEEDFTNSLKDPYYRFIRNSSKIGHAVILKSPSGDLIAMQYKLPENTNQSEPKICELSNIEMIRRYNMTRFRAIDEDGKTYYAKRYNHGHFTDEFDETKSIDFAYFSEEEEADKEPFWGSSDKPLVRFSTNLQTDLQRDFDNEIADIPNVTKGGYDLEIEPDSVNYRDENPRRNPDQNTVMGESARDHYEHIYNTYEDVMSEELKKVFKRAFLADIRKSPENQFRPEWLHAYGHGLTPKTINPQVKTNLGAGGKWVNTEMMILERMAKWFAQHQNDSAKTIIRLNSFLSMLLDSEIIDWLRFTVEFEQPITDGQKRILKFIQELDPFKKYPLFRKSSDLAQATGLTYALLHDTQPYKIEKVIGEYKISDICSQNIFSSQIDETSISNSSHQTVVSHSNTFREGDLNMPRQSNSRHIRYAKSIVKIETSFHEHNHYEPWVGPQLLNSSGSGFVIEHEGEKYVLTNAHVVANQITTEVILASHQQEKFYAKPVCVCYQSDLALLKIKKRKFQSLAEPVEFGEMVKIDDEVTAVGFPMGGQDICFTQGPISRIESDIYAISGCKMLHVQTQSPINPGNSGGPVFLNDKVIGVAFQKIEEGDSLGYIIPIPIIMHFLEEALTREQYHGFPVLPIEIQNLDNAYQRRLFYNMHDSQSGVLVNKTDYLSEIGRKLKPQDIILEIDGHNITNDGKTNIAGIDNEIDFNHLTHMKFIGDSVELKVLRKNHLTNECRIISIDVKLECTPGQTKIIKPLEFDKRPTYYINSGIVFTPVTINSINALFQNASNINPSILGWIDAYKKHPDEQLIMINKILNCKYTKGYAGYTNQIVKSVNSKNVKNMDELIDAFKTNNDSFHTIETMSNKLIVLKKMPELAFQKLLDKYQITFDRSKDLDYAGIQTLKYSRTASESNSDLSNLEPQNEALISRESIENAKMPGQRHFMELLLKMQNSLAANEEDEDILDFDNLTELDDEEKEEEFIQRPRLNRLKNQIDNDSENEEEVNPYAKQPKKTHLSSGNTLFERKRSSVCELQSGKRRRRDLEDEQDLQMNVLKK